MAINVLKRSSVDLIVRGPYHISYLFNDKGTANRVDSMILRLQIGIALNLKPRSIIGTSIGTYRNGINNKSQLIVSPIFFRLLDL